MQLPQRSTLKQIGDITLGFPESRDVLGIGEKKHRIAVLYLLWAASPTSGTRRAWTLRGALTEAKASENYPAKNSPYLLRESG